MMKCDCSDCLFVVQM